LFVIRDIWVDFFGFDLQKLAEITGSRAYERFTGSQIAKIYQTKKTVYNNTEVSLTTVCGMCEFYLLVTVLQYLLLRKIQNTSLFTGTVCHFYSVKTFCNFGCKLKINILFYQK
jgi:hypothetical protein